MRAIGFPKEQLCMGGLTGVYPIEIPGEVCCPAQTKITEYIDE